MFPVRSETLSLKFKCLCRKKIVFHFYSFKLVQSNPRKRSKFMKRASRIKREWLIWFE